MARKRTPPPAPSEPPANLAGLVQACKDDPDDDGLRGILADYLEDHGEPDRAEFLRLSLLVSRPLAELESFAAAHARMARLLRQNEARWLGGLPQAEAKWRFDRGFVEILCGMSSLRSPEMHAALAGVGPWMQRLFLGYGQQPAAAECANHPAALHFSAVHFTRAGLGAQTTRAIAASPLAPHLRELAVELRERPAGAALPLFEAGSRLTNLRELRLRGRLSLVECQGLVQAPFAATLASLSLSVAELNDVHYETLVSPGRLTNLRSLHIEHGKLNPVAVTSLAELPSGLRRLELLSCQLYPHSLHLLARSPVLSQVQTLNLRGNKIYDGTTALAHSENLGSLEYLDLSDNLLVDEEVEMLANAPGLSRLRTLRLEQHAMQGPGVLALARSPVLGRLEQLSLITHHASKPVEVLPVVTSTHLPSLVDLDLSGTRITANTLEALVAGPLAPRLRRLALNHTDVTDAGATLLAAATSLGNLESLELVECPLGEAGVRALAASAALKSLAWLRLTVSPESEPGLAALAQKDGLPALTFLDLVGAPPTTPTRSALLNSSRHVDLFAIRGSAYSKDLPGYARLGRYYPKAGILG